MPLIKGNNAKDTVRDAVVLDFGDLNREAERIVAHAQQQAERIVAEANAKAEQLVSNASDRGFAEGREAGLNAAMDEGREIGRNEALNEYRTKIESLLKTWSSAIERWENDRTQMYMQAREDVLRFASAVAEKVIRRHIECDPKIIHDQIEEALQIISRPSSVIVSINPDDRGSTEDIVAKLLERFRNCEHIELQDNANISRGGCVVSTRDGTIDASIERQLQRIVETIFPDESKKNDAKAPQDSDDDS